MAEQALQPASDAEPDVVTQLQTCLDQLATQLYASLRYITTRHPLSAPLEPLELPSTQTTASTQATSITTAHSTPNGNNTSFPSTATPASAHLSQNSPPTSQPQTRAPAPSPSHPQLPTAATASYLQRYPRFTDPLQNPSDPTDSGEDKFEPISPSHQPLSIPEFEAAARELAQDLVAKQKQIEGLIGLLPDEIGEGKEKERQEKRLQELDKELEGIRGEVELAQRRKERMLERVDGVVACWANGGV